MQDLRSVEVVRELSRRVTQLEQNERKMKYDFERCNNLLMQAIENIRELKKENENLKVQRQEKEFSQLPQPPISFDYSGLRDESDSDEDTEKDSETSDDESKVFENQEQEFTGNTCWGCRENQPNQLAHMDKGGCLYFVNSDDEDDPEDTALNTLIDEMDITDEN